MCLGSAYYRRAPPLLGRSIWRLTGSKPVTSVSSWSLLQFLSPSSCLSSCSLILNCNLEDKVFHPLSCFWLVFYHSSRKQTRIVCIQIYTNFSNPINYILLNIFICIIYIYIYINKNLVRLVSFSIAFIVPHPQTGGGQRILWNYQSNNFVKGLYKESGNRLENIGIFFLPVSVIAVNYSKRYKDLQLPPCF